MERYLSQIDHKENLADWCIDLTKDPERRKANNARAYEKRKESQVARQQNRRSNDIDVEDPFAV
jgi:hypothetical protein